MNACRSWLPSVLVVWMVVCFVVPSYGADYVIVGWGRNLYGQIDIPPGYYIAIGASQDNSIAVRKDGTIEVWGHGGDVISKKPTGNDFIAVDAGWKHCTALRSNGTLESWGTCENEPCPTWQPGGYYFTFSSSDSWNVAIRTGDSVLVAWGNIPVGNDIYAAANCNPPGPFTDVAVKRYRGLFVRGNGSLDYCCLLNDAETFVPEGNDYIAVAATRYHGAAIKSDGSLISWEWQYGELQSVPSGNDFIAIAGGINHFLALRSDGTLAVWGDDQYRQMTDMPTCPGFIAIATGGDYCLALGYGTVETFLTGYQSTWRDQAVAVSWELSEVIPDLHFTVSRRIDPDGAFRKISPTVVREGNQFSFRDESVERGTVYTYRVDVLDSDGIAASFEASLTTPPLDFMLYQCHPNPFSRSTTVRFDLSRRARAVLSVYDLQGRHVRTLKDADLPSGSGSTVWNGRDASGRLVSSGVYFVRLKTRNAMKAQKIMLIR